MPADSHSEISALRSQMFIQLIALVMVALCLTAYLYRQASLQGKQITQSLRVINGYKRQEPKIVDLLNQLVAYSQKHPEFSRAVLKKYGVGTDTAAK